MNEDISAISSYVNEICDKKANKNFDEALVKKLKKKEFELNSLIILNEEIKKKLNSEKINNMISNKKLEELKKVNEEMEYSFLAKKNLTELSDISKFKNILLKKNDEINQLKENILKLTNKNYELNRTIKFLQAEIEKINSDNCDAQKKYKELLKLNIQYQSLMNSSNGLDEIINLKSNNDLLANEVQELKSVNLKVENDYENIQKELKFFKGKINK